MKKYKFFFLLFALAFSIDNVCAQNLYLVWKNGVATIKSMPTGLWHYDYVKHFNFYVVHNTISSNEVNGSFYLKLYSNVVLPYQIFLEKEAGICLSQIAYPSVSDRKVTIRIDSRIEKDKEYKYNFSVTGLKPNTKYYFRPYITIGDKTWYGDPGVLTTSK